jgi:hypothetical protein
MADLISYGMGTPASWTSANGLTTTGILNPFGLKQNNPAIGYNGAPQPQQPAQPQSVQAPPPTQTAAGQQQQQPQAPPSPTNNFQAVPPGYSVMPDGSYVRTPTAQQSTSGQAPYAWNPYSYVGSNPWGSAEGIAALRGAFGQQQPRSLQMTTGYRQGIGLGLPRTAATMAPQGVTEAAPRGLTPQFRRQWPT